MKPKTILLAGLILWVCAMFAGPVTLQLPAGPPAEPVKDTSYFPGPHDLPGTGEPTGHRYNDPSIVPSTPTEVLAEIRLLPKACQDDLAAIKRLSAKVRPDDACPADNDDVRYYTGIAHEQHGLLPIGFVDKGLDPRKPTPDGHGYHEFHLDPTGRLAAVVFHGANGKRRLTDRLIYEGGEVIARLSFGPEGFSYGDYGLWRDGKLRMVGRVLADGNVAFYECIIWTGDREDYTVCYCQDRAASGKMTLQYVFLGTVCIDFKSDGTIERIWRYSNDPRRPAPGNANLPADKPGNVFAAANPGYKARAEAFYEKEYLDKALNQLAAAVEMTDKQKAAARKFMRAFIDNWLDSYVCGGGHIGKEDLARCLALMDERFQGELSPAGYKAYLAWRMDQTGADNALSFLMNPRFAVKKED